MLNLRSMWSLETCLFISFLNGFERVFAELT